jgi:hypothetical protein
VTLGLDGADELPLPLGLSPSGVDKRDPGFWRVAGVALVRPRSPAHRSGGLSVEWFPQVWPLCRWDQLLVCAPFGGTWGQQ